MTNPTTQASNAALTDERISLDLKEIAAEFQDRLTPCALEALDLAAARLAALAAQAPTIDPTDPGHEVEVLREHVRHLERRVQQLSAQAPTAMPLGPVATCDLPVYACTPTPPQAAVPAAQPAEAAASSMDRYLTLAHDAVTKLYLAFEPEDWCGDERMDACAKRALDHLTRATAHLLEVQEAQRTSVLLPKAAEGWKWAIVIDVDAPHKEQEA